jgi:hypothetical protein
MKLRLILPALLTVVALSGLTLASSSASASTTLKPLLLTTADIPSGWSSTPPSSSNSSAPPKCFAGFESSGSGKSVQADFEQGQDGPRFSETLDSDPGQATAGLQRFAEAMFGCKSFSVQSGGQTATGTITPIPSLTVGAKSIAFKMSISVSFITVPVYLLATEHKNNVVAILAYTDLGSQAVSASSALKPLALDAYDKLSGKKTPDYGANLPKSVGQSVTFNSETVTLVRIVDPAQPSNQYETPDAGDRYVGLEFKIVNIGTTAFQPEPTSDSTVIDTALHSYQSTFADLTGCPSFADSLTLNPGEAADGCVTFGIPTAPTIAKVQYSESGGTRASGEWTMTPPA